MFGPWYYVLKYAKIKRMKNKKKSLLSRFGLVGVSGVIVLGAILKKQKDEKRKEQVKEQIRIRDIRIKELEAMIAALKKELEETREELRKAQIRIMDLEKEIEELKGLEDK